MYNQYASTKKMSRKSLTFNECLTRMTRMFGVYARKMTSYKVVKGRLNYRFYSDFQLTERKRYQEYLKSQK